MCMCIGVDVHGDVDVDAYVDPSMQMYTER